jgi:hypothetical protein
LYFSRIRTAFLLCNFISSISILLVKCIHYLKYGRFLE